MADESDNLMLVMLREIRAKQSEHDQQLAKLNKQLEHASKQLEHVNEAAYLGIGIATMTARKVDEIGDRLETLEQRLQALEARPG